MTQVYIAASIDYDHVDNILGVFSTKVKAAEHIETLAENDYQYYKNKYPDSHKSRRHYQGFYIILIAELDNPEVDMVEEFL